MRVVPQILGFSEARVKGLLSPAPDACAVAAFQGTPTRLVPASWQELQFELINVDA